RRRVGRIEPVILRDLRRSGIARGAVKCGDGRVTMQGAGQRMLAAARAKDEDSHHKRAYLPPAGQGFRSPRPQVAAVTSPPGQRFQSARRPKWWLVSCHRLCLGVKGGGRDESW